MNKDLKEKAYEIEITNPYSPKWLKFKNLVSLAKCTEEEAKEAFEWVWDKTY